MLILSSIIYPYTFPPVSFHFLLFILLLYMFKIVIIGWLLFNITIIIFLAQSYNTSTNNLYYYTYSWILRLASSPLLSIDILILYILLYINIISFLLVFIFYRIFMFGLGWERIQFMANLWFLSHRDGMIINV